MLRRVSTRTAGLAIVFLAIWGGLIPFVGPYFHFTLGPDHTWTWTTARLYLSVLPAVGALIGGLWLVGAGPWASGRVGAVLALLSGIWFAIGPEMSTLWHHGGQVGVGHGTAIVQAMEQLGLHSGLGAVIAALAGFALPSAVGRRVPAEPVATRGTTAPATTVVPAAADRTAAPAAADRTAAPAAADRTAPPTAAPADAPTRVIDPATREDGGA